MNATGMASGGGFITLISWLWSWLAMPHGAPEMPAEVAGWIALAAAGIGHFIAEYIKARYSHLTAPVS